MITDEELAEKIRNGAVGVMATDTIYGVVGSALLSDVSDRIKHIKKRDVSKRFIILIGNRGQLPSLGITLTDSQLDSLNEVWPGPVSVAIDCDDTLDYIHNGHKNIAVRLPADTALRQFINQTGPIIATSANISGQPTSSDINDIKSQLPGLDFYVAGQVAELPSRLARLEPDGQITWLNRSY